MYFCVAVCCYKTMRNSLFLACLLLTSVIGMTAHSAGEYKLFLQNDKSVSYCVPTQEVDSVTVVSMGSKKLLKIYSPGGKVQHSALVSSTDYMRVLPDSVCLLEYAAYKNGDDWAPALEKALGYHSIVYVPEGEYSCSQLNIPSGKTLRGAGEKTVFVPLTAGLFRVDGSKGKGAVVAEDVADHSDLLVLTDAPALKVGDDVMIQSQRNCMLKEGIEGINYDAHWVLGRTAKTSVFYGEFDKVQSIDGRQVKTVGKRIFPCYYKDDSREPEVPSDGYVTRPAATVHKVDFAKNVILADFAIKGTAQCYKPILLKYVDSCKVENVHYGSSVLTCNEDSAYSLTIIRIMYSKNTVIKDCHSILEEEALRQLNALERNWDNFSCYNIFKIESRRCKASHNIWSGMNITQGCWNNEVSDCVVTSSGQGITVFSRLSRIVNNTVSTDLPFGTNYIYTHVSSKSNGKTVYLGGTAGIMLPEGYSGGQKDKRTVVSGNTVSGFYTGISVRDGYESKNIFETGIIDITGNKIEGCFNGVGIYRNGYNTTPVYLDIIVSNNSFVRAVDLAPYSNTYEPKAIYVPAGVTGVVSDNNTQKGF